LGKNSIKQEMIFTIDNKKALMDTNIIVYSNDTTEADKHLITKKFLKTIVTSHDIFISVQNLGEFSRIITEKISRPLSYNKAKEMITNYSNAFKTITYSEKTILRALTLKSESNLHFWDSLIVATMEENSINTIITENEKDFRKVKWIKVINPFKKDNM